jgi:hypothetical protein
MSFVDEILEHHGTKGMKWGVRRSSSSRAKKTGPLDANKLSDTELKSLINRMQMEQQYKQLSKSGTGRKYAKSLLENAGRTAVGVAASAAAGFAVKAALDRAAPAKVKK